MGVGVPDLLDGSCCGSLSGFWVESCTTGRSTSISVALKAAKKYLLGSSPWYRILGSLDAGASVVVFFDFYVFSSDGICLSLFCSRNYSLHWAGSPFVVFTRDFFISLCVRA
jgi:hypothetical protein